ncbi:MAG TPA: cation diffusion facilitator family transporter [Bacteroidales bacterium]|nr:cation diffusion facilitator family transporter [Bacteroidales bacterium]
MSETGHRHHEVSGKNLGFAILLNAGITIAQAIGGIISGSMALLSDAAHNFSDVLSMVISYLANRLSKRDATEKQTFGFRRSEILAAFINSATLIIISVIILFEAIQRLINPVTISANLVIWLAIAGILVNGISVLFIRNDSHENMNMKSVYLHLFGDMLTSVAVLLGGLAMKYLQWFWTDSVFSMVIAIYLLYMSWGIFRSSLRIIMQFTPEEVDIHKIVKEIENIGGVKNTHHVHVWQINEHDLMFEAHVDVSEDISVSNFGTILDQIKEILHRHNIDHSTIQPEYMVDDKKQLIH